MVTDGEDPQLPAVDTLEELEELGQAVAARLAQMTVLLLGRGRELGKRRRLQACLEEGQDVDAQLLIMEDYPDQDDEDPGEKWDRLVANEEPEDFILLVPEEGSMSGVGPEYGRIRERLGQATRHYVHFFWPDGVDTREVLDPYMGTMAGNAHAEPYADEDELCEQVYRLLENLALRDVQGRRP